MALKGDINKLRDLRTRLKDIPVTAVAEIAAQAAPDITQRARSAFDGGQDIYGASRPEAAQGGDLSLVKTGATRAALRFIATGRDIRVARLPKYARYLIGRYGILPNGNQQLPLRWRSSLADTARRVLKSRL